MIVSGINYIKYPSINDGMHAVTKIRYKDAGMESIVYNENDAIRVEFVHDVNGIAPGQSAVIYEGDDVVAGGVIQKGY